MTVLGLSISHKQRKQCYKLAMCKHSGTHSKTSTLKMFLLPHSTPGVQLSSDALLSNLHDLLQVLALKTSLHPFRGKPKPQSTGYLGVTTPPLSLWEPALRVLVMLKTEFGSAQQVWLFQ